MVMPMEKNFTDYIRRKDLPEGWLGRTDAEIIGTILSAQQSAGVTGSAVEIGVHHGKLMIALCLGLKADELAYAIDIFEEQHLNKDHSGSGDRAIFERNLARFGVPQGQVIIDARSSEAVKPGDILDAVRPARLFSVDGGHWAEIVENDLRLAEASIAPEGVIALDDFHRPEWPDVSAGYFSWFGKRSKPLLPFAIGFNKLYLCDEKQLGFYQGALAASPYLKAYLAKDVVFQGVHLPVYHQMLFPEMSRKTRLENYLMLFHPDYFLPPPKLSARLRSALPVIKHQAADLLDNIAGIIERPHPRPGRRP